MQTVAPKGCSILNVLLIVISLTIIGAINYIAVAFAFYVFKKYESSFGLTNNTQVYVF